MQCLCHPDFIGLAGFSHMSWDGPVSLCAELFLGCVLGVLNIILCKSGSLNPMDSSQFDHIEHRLPVPPSPLRALPLEFGSVLKATEVLLGSVSSEHQTMAGPAAGGLFVGRQYSGPRNKHPLRDECSLAPLYRFPEWLRPCLPPSLPEPGHWDHPSLLENPNPISKLNINQVRRLLTDGKGQEWKRPWRYEQRSGSAQAQPDNYLTSQMMPFTEALANDTKANHGTFLK